MYFALRNIFAFLPWCLSSSKHDIYIEIEKLDSTYGPHREVQTRYVNETNANLVNLHAEFNFIEGQEVHQYSDCSVCSINYRGCDVVKRDIQRLLNEGETTRLNF